MAKQNTSAKFITLEGGEGAGKSTSRDFIERLLTQHQIPFITSREPGGTAIGEQLRTLLLTKVETPPVPSAELLMMFAARAQHLHEVIEPALARGVWVLCDRFTVATYAYQGYGRGYDLEAIGTLERLVQQGRQPDLTLLFDIDPRVGIERARQRAELDRFEEEALSFFERVRNGYLQRAAMESRFAVIDAARSVEDVQATLTETLRPIIEGWM